MVDAENLKYKDPKQPVGVRVKDLLGRMTLEEKIGQMVQIDRSVANATVMKDYFIGKTSSLSRFLYALCFKFGLEQFRIVFGVMFLIWFISALDGS